MISVTASAIVSGALRELNAVQSGAPVPGEVMVDGLELLNLILDDFNADESKVYATLFSQFTITPNLNPHTIGPAASAPTWTLTQRPVSIEAMAVLLTGTPVPYVPIRQRDKAWWQRNPSPTTTATYPTDYYYDATWPNGSVYLWPVPTTAYTVQLMMRVILAQVQAATTVTLPPGYAYALRMLLAQRWAPSLRKPWTPKQEQLTVEAVRVFTSNNAFTPRIATRDAGMPSGKKSGLPDFMWPYGGIGSPR